jgi:pyruvate dehydrogenase E2 component (dihydrolipoyllysine-residue acetyltransferase)
MDVLMPQLGETVSEGKVIKWFKSVGDAVAPGENLCEIETDKVTVEVPAIAPGILQAINVDVGTVAPVGAIIAVLDEAATLRPDAAADPDALVLNTSAAPLSLSAGLGAGASAPGRRQLDPFREVQTPHRNFGPARLANGILVTPLARRLSADAGIDLTQIRGSGARGRITGRDIEKAIAARPAALPPLARAETFDELIGDVHRSRPHALVPVDSMRQTVVRRHIKANATIPHFYLSADIAIDRSSRIRHEINAGAALDREGAPAYRLSLDDFMVRALALALQAVPAANAIWSDDGILAFRHADIAVAVPVSGGPLTPVVLAAETKTLSIISNEIAALSARAREGTVEPRECEGGATTIFSLAAPGIRAVSTMIRPPQSTLLAIAGSRRDAVEAEDGRITFASRISATLSCDRRVVDEVAGAELLASFAAFMENPLRMLA